MGELDRLAAKLLDQLSTHAILDNGNKIALVHAIGLYKIGCALAISKDGLHWERPVLDQVEIGGSKVVIERGGEPAAALVPIADLRRRKATFSQEEYENQLEARLIDLALANRAVRAREAELASQ